MPEILLRAQLDGGRERIYYLKIWVPSLPICTFHYLDNLVKFLLEVGRK